MTNTLCWRTLHVDLFSKRTLKGRPVVAVREERRSPNQMPKRVKGKKRVNSEAMEAAKVKRHLVCKRWTIDKADENSNDTPWSALHRLNSDKLRFHLPSPPLFDA